MSLSAATWEFEPADPEVGFLTDTVTHACAANEDDAEPAVIVDSRQWPNSDGKTVSDQTTFECPVCKATTATTEHWPLSFFEEPRA